MFHITDWFTTILGFAGLADGLDVDGIDQWDSLSTGGSTCSRTTMVHNIVTDDNGDIETAAYRDGNYKIIIGDPGDLTGWWDEEQTEILSGEDTTLYLFDIENDPEEYTNLATDENYSDILSSLQSTVTTLSAGIVDFSTSGNCDEADVIDDDGNWITGCCNI